MKEDGSTLMAWIAMLIACVVLFLFSYLPYRLGFSAGRTTEPKIAATSTAIILPATAFPITNIFYVVSHDREVLKISASGTVYLYGKKVGTLTASDTEMFSKIRF